MYISIVYTCLCIQLHVSVQVFICTHYVCVCRIVLLSVPSLANINFLVAKNDSYLLSSPLLSSPLLSSPLSPQGVSHPVNVKVADTEKDKELKRLQAQLQLNQSPGAALTPPNVRFSGLTPNMGIDTYSYMRQVREFISFNLPLFISLVYDAFSIDPPIISVGSATASSSSSCYFSWQFIWTGNGSNAWK